ncbi:MAG: dehydratase [Kribbellaceae bacterium]|nr:dehydratase [Kribbellaceae bacterium]
MATHRINMLLRKSSTLAIPLVLVVALSSSPAAMAQPELAGLDASAAVPTASYACRADTKFGKQTFSLRQGVNAKAPANVKAGAGFTMAVDLKPGQLPSEVKGFKLKEVRDLTLRIPVPNNTWFISGRLIGGSGLGSTPTLEHSGRVVTVRLGGPVPGGSAYQLPTLSVRLKAGGSGRVVKTTLQGTSFDNPGLTLTATIKWKFITIKSPVACYPNPNPTLTRTQIR